MKLIVYGSSDDLVEVEGDICEEFTINWGEGTLALSDGTTARIVYDGVWRFLDLKPGKLTPTIHPDVPEDTARREDGEFEGMSTYSEILVLEGDVEITSISFGKQHWIAPPDEPAPKVTALANQLWSGINGIHDSVEGEALLLRRLLVENGVTKLIVIDNDADMFRVTVEQI